MKYKDRDWLYEEYYVKRRLTHKIAKDCGIGVSTINRYVNMFGIPKPPTPSYEEVEILCSECKQPFTRTLAKLLQRVRATDRGICCSISCAAKLRMKDEEVSSKLHAASRVYQASEEGKAVLRAAALKSTISRQANKGRTNIEHIMAEELDRRGIQYIEQYAVGNRFLLDFFLPDYGVGIECDGEHWHLMPERIESDKRKVAYVEGMGIGLFRFWGKEIKKDVKTCVDSIKLCKEQAGG